MNEESTQNGKTLKNNRGFLGLILLCNFVILILVISAIGSKKKSNIKFEITPELESAMLQSVTSATQNSQKEIKNEAKSVIENTMKDYVAKLEQQKQILNSLQAELADVQKEIKQKLGSTPGNLNQQNTQSANQEKALNELKASTTNIQNQSASQERTLNDLRASMASIQRQIQELEKSFSIIKNYQNNNTQEYSAQKRDAYLSSARNKLNTPEIAKILYLSALSYSEEKASILNEIIDWQLQMIAQKLRSNDDEGAKDILIDLAQICDMAIASGSISDMESIPTIKNKLSSADKAIQEIVERRISTQKQQLDIASNQINRLSTYEDAEKMISLLNEFSCDVSLEDYKDELISRVVSAESYLTRPNQEIIIPEINDDTPWLAWLNNFIYRMQSNLSIDKKMEDLITAADFLEAAKQSNVDGVARKFTDLESVIKQISRSHWAERVDEVCRNTDSDLNEVASLLAETKGFSTSEQNAYRQRIISLNGYISNKTNLDLEESVKQLRALEQKVNSETYMQMIGMIQGQYYQFLLHLQGLEQKYPGQFSGGITRVVQNVNALASLSNASKNQIVIADLKNTNSQREEFVKWARNKLDWAAGYDKQGEDVASQWTRTRSSPEAIKHYQDAWTTLMQIHPGDLQYADPALYQVYSELKTKIENHWTPTNDYLQNVKYTRISDF